MATLYITEYFGLMPAPQGQVGQIPMEPAVTEQTVTIGVSSTQSAVIGSKVVRLHCDAICSVKFGANPTATAASRRLAANQTEFVSVPAGFKVAVITNS